MHIIFCLPAGRQVSSLRKTGKAGKLEAMPGSEILTNFLREEILV
jgi:hypothetical protein